MAVTLELAHDYLTSNGEQRVNFTITNQSAVPAFDVKLEFDVTGDGRLVSADAERGDCGATGCHIRSFDNHASLKGHLVVAPDRGFDREARVSVDVSWELSNSGRRHYYDDIMVQPVDSGQPGDLIWLTIADASGISCGDKIVVGPDAVYADFYEKLYAVSRSSGEVLWVVEQTIGDTLLAGGSIYYSTGIRGRSEFDHRYFILSLDAQNGELNWETEIEGNTRGPGLIYGDTVFYTVNVPETRDRPWSHYLLALEASTGIMNWRYRVGKYINTSALEDNGTIYFGTYGGRPDFLYGVDPVTGELRHQHLLTGGPIDTPHIEDGVSYINASGQTVRALDLPTGQEKWVYWPDDIPFRTPVMTEGSIHLAITYKETHEIMSIATLDAETGALKWDYRSDEPLKGVSASGESVYAPSATKLVSLNAHTGSVNWEVNYSRLCSPPTVVDGILYGRAHNDGEYVIYAIRGE